MSPRVKSVLDDLGGYHIQNRGPIDVKVSIINKLADHDKNHNILSSNSILVIFLKENTEGKWLPGEIFVYTANRNPQATGLCSDN